MLRITAHLPVALALAALLSTSPALAQGKGNGNGKGNGKAKAARELVQEREQRRPELRRREVQRDRDDDRYEDERDDRYRDGDDRYDRNDDRYDDWGDDRYDDRSSAKQGPPFCRNGQGHPVHGRRWCVDKGFGLGRSDSRRDDRYYEDGRYDRGSYGSYAEEHAAFHRWLDRKYSDIAARRPLDIQYQIRLRAEKKAEHDRWHAQAGRRHQ